MMECQPTRGSHGRTQEARGAHEEPAKPKNPRPRPRTTARREEPDLSWREASESPREDERHPCELSIALDH